MSCGIGGRLRLDRAGSNPGAISYYSASENGDAADKTFVFGQLQWERCFGCEVEDYFEPPPGESGHNLFFMPSKINGKSYTVNILRSMLGKGENPVDVLSHLEFRDNTDADRHLFSRAPENSYWCSFSNGKTVECIDPKSELVNPLILEVMTLYAIKIKAAGLEMTSNPVWCREKINGKRLSLGVSTNTINIKAEVIQDPLRAYEVQRFVMGDWCIS